MKQLQITNGIEQKLRSISAPQMTTVRNVGNAAHVDLGEIGADFVPASVEVCPTAQEFEPGTNCEQVSRRKSWQFEAVVAWNRLVAIDEWCDTVAHEAIQSPVGEPNSWTARLMRVESIYRPDTDPESGTFLLLTFEILTR